MRHFLILSAIIFFISIDIIAQETNSWTNQVGNVATLMGGASTSRAEDNSSIFYNPGGLSFVSGPTLSLTADAYFFNFLNIENGAGDGIDLESSSLNGAPLLVSGTLKFKKKPDFAITWAILNKELYTINMKARYDASLDVIQSRPGEELYTGSYKYLNRTREDWFGFGISRRFAGKVGLGVSTFFTARSKDFERRISATAFEVIDEFTRETNTLGLNAYNEDFEHRHLGVLWVFGVSYQEEKFHLGLTITTPKVGIPVLNGSLTRSSTINIPSQDISTTSSIFQDKVVTYHQTPWKFDLGGDYVFKNSVLTARIGLDAALKPFEMLKNEPSNNPVTDVLQPLNPAFSNFQSAYKMIVNFGLGYAHDIKEGLGILAGFRTDFNNYDQETLPRESNFVESISYWDLYHLTCGPAIYTKKLNITAGFAYAFGLSKGDLQQVNFTNPSDETLLLGTRNNSTETSYHQIGIVFGITYLFDTVSEN